MNEENMTPMSYPPARWNPLQDHTPVYVPMCPCSPIPKQCNIAHTHPKCHEICRPSCAFNSDLGRSMQNSTLALLSGAVIAGPIGNDWQVAHTTRSRGTLRSFSVYNNSDDQKQIAVVSHNTVLLKDYLLPAHETVHWRELPVISDLKVLVKGDNARVAAGIIVQSEWINEPRTERFRQMLENAHRFQNVAFLVGMAGPVAAAMATTALTTPTRQMEKSQQLTPSKFINIRVDVAVKQQLEQLAAAESLDLSSYIRKHYLELVSQGHITSDEQKAKAEEVPEEEVDPRIKGVVDAIEKE